ncbi:MAG: hypothetical protein WBE26_03905 [Phycisphaerae bacterium]
MARSANIQRNDRRSGWVRRVVLVALFAVAFGYVEAAVVVYLRVIYDPVRASLYPDQPPGSLLPLVTLEQLREADPLHIRRLGIELGRELATMVMLVTVASLARRRRGEWVAMFMISFGVWDIAYYVGLKAMIGFPASLLTWDILFLLPVPWLGPVLAPVIVSLSMIGAGLVLLAEAGRGRVLRAGWFHWVAIIVGGLVIIVSFCYDYARTTTGELPGRFNWLVFAAGEAIGLLAFAHAMTRGRRSLEH